MLIAHFSDFHVDPFGRYSRSKSDPGPGLWCPLASASVNL